MAVKHLSKSEFDQAVNAGEDLVVVDFCGEHGRNPSGSTFLQSRYRRGNRTGNPFPGNERPHPSLYEERPDCREVHWPCLKG